MAWFEIFVSLSLDAHRVNATLHLAKFPQRSIFGKNP